MANQSYKKGSTLDIVPEHGIRIHLSCKWRQRVPPKRGNRLILSGIIYKTGLKQYCENRMKQIYTLCGQNEFIIRLVVRIDTIVLYKETCDILKADSCPSDGTPHLLHKYLSVWEAIAMYSENRWIIHVNYADEVYAGPVMCSKFPFSRNLPHTKLARMELKK